MKSVFDRFVFIDSSEEEKNQDSILDFLSFSFFKYLDDGNLYHNGKIVLPSCIDQCSRDNKKYLNPHDLLLVNGSLFKIINLAKYV